MRLGIDVNHERLSEFCRKHHIRELSFFGSVLRDDFRADSDVDVLVEYQPGAHVGMRELLAMEDELRAMFGRPVDLVEGQAVRESPNYIRRREILGTAQVAYAQQ